MKILLNNWPQKVLALSLAILAWFSINQNTRSTSQRELSVPVTVEGRASDQIETGAPRFVNITVAGETSQVNRLRPENFDAVLDLSGLEGEYEQTIIVVPPQGVRLLNTEPDTAIGVVESIDTKTVPVETAVLGAMPDDMVLDALAEPSEVIVRGRSSTLEDIDKAVALINTRQEGEVTLYATNTDNRPVPEVTLEPNTVSISLGSEPVLHTRSVPLSVSEPETDLVLSDFSVSQPSLEVAGAEEVLADLQSVDASVETDTTPAFTPGEYTLEVRPQLPDGVRALERVSVSFSLAAPPREPETNEDESEDDAAEEPLGEEDDASSAPVRRPGSTQDSDADNNVR